MAGGYGWFVAAVTPFAKLVDRIFGQWQIRYMWGVRHGDPEGGDVKVTVVEDGVARSLPMRLDLRSYSPDGLEWGYGNAGPAQLALAILADVTGNDQYALRHHHWFKLEVVATLPWDGWKLAEDRVRRWIQQHHPLEG